MRKALLLGGALLVVALVVFGLKFSNPDKLVKQAIESAGSKATGVPVTVAKTTVSLTEGKATIEGLNIANPPGFSTPTAFYIETISATLDIRSLTSDPIHIKHISVSKPAVTYEVSSAGSNLQTIQKEIESRANARKLADGAAGKAETKEPRLLIDQLNINGGTITLAAINGKLNTTVPLGELALSNLGKDSQGLTGAELGSQVIDAMIKPTLKAVAQASLRQAGDFLSNTLFGKSGNP